ncbi:MAG: uracil-DNA glycosylase family protein [Parasphingorhabdus sp.]
MIFSEKNNANVPSSTDIASLQHWWSLAGVDLDYTEKPHSLLEETVQPKAVTIDDQPAAMTKVQEEPAVFEDAPDFPNEIGAFLQWLQKPGNLVEKNWAREFVIPEGQTEPKYMIISAMPETVNLGTASHFSQQSRDLVQNMLKALGVELEQCFHTPLALGRPVDGQIAKQYMKPLLNRVVHLISLIKPERIILLGDTVSHAFFGEDLLTARQKKQFINHSSSKTEAIVTFHPRILLTRPELKTEAWKDLQQLTRIGAQ